MSWRTVAWSTTLGLLTAAGIAGAASIGGVAFEDPDRNGAMDPGEPALAGVQLALMGAEGTVLRRTVSGADGSFLFADLPDGDYVVTALADARLRASHPEQGVDPPPIPDFPFGRARYAAPSGMVRNLYRVTARGASYRHVALGDSIGFGFNFCGSLGGEDGYIEPTTERLRRATAASVVTDKQAVPGDETNDLLDPDGNFPFGPNDIFYAVDQKAGLVSISIGGNDFLGAEGGGDAALADALVTARRNLQEIVSSLAGESPFSDLELNTVYDNLEGLDPLHNVWAPIWNQVLREVAWGQVRRVTLAEVYREYAHQEGGEIFGQRGLICNDFLGLDGIHPTEDGYDVHEEKLWQSWGGVTLAGEDQLGMELGFLRESREQTAAGFVDVTDSATDPEAALAIDGVGALIPSDSAEFRLVGFRPDPVPPGELAQAVLKVRYRTTGAPLDDEYRFEASVDGSFSPPGNTPGTWNTILPVVGSAGNGVDIVAYPDQPEFREVAASVYLGAPIDGGATLLWDDLASLEVRVVTLPVGDPDPFEIELDGAWVEIHEVPAGAARRPAPGAQLGADDPAVRLRAGLALLARDPEAARRSILNRLTGEADPALAALLPEVCRPSDVGLLGRLLRAHDPMVRGHAARALGCLDSADRVPLLTAATMDSNPGVRRAAARGLADGGADAPFEVLLRLTSDADSAVRRIAVAALGSRALGSRTGAEEALLASLRWDDERAVRVDAALALLGQANSAGVDELVEAALDLPPVERAADALAGVAVATPRLLAALESADARRRARAATLLGASAGETAAVRAALRQRLDDAAPEVRRAAAYALATRGDAAALEYWVGVPLDGPQVVDAARSLARFDSVPARAALARIAAAAEAAPTARRLAARSLALSDARDAVGHLEALSTADSPRVQRLARAGLARRSG